MKYLLSLALVLVPSIAVAHVGHIGELAGHDHLIAGAAVGIAAGVAIWGWLKGEQSGGDAETQAEDVEDPELQEA